MQTYLYIKQHSVTGKLYFGKTIRNPEKYLGSGVHWLNHIRKHGTKHVVNLWYYLFETKEECTEFAIEFSNKMNIVESDQWLNLCVENGIGGPIGYKHSDYNKNKISEKSLNRKWSEQSKLKASKSHSGKPKSEEHKANLRGPKSDEHKANMRKPKSTTENMKGPRGPIKNPHVWIEVTCPHCGLNGKGTNMKRYHFDKCKNVT